MTTRKVPEPTAPLIKICGLTSLADARVAGQAGAHYLGFNFTRTSKRRVSVSQLQAWWPDLPTTVKRVALFQDQPAEDVKAVIESLDVDVLQFHGTESAAYCASFGVTYWKAIAMRDATSFDQAAREHIGAEALLLDTVTKAADGCSISGGTGQAFDWSLWPISADPNTQRLILAGGLDPENVGAAIRQIHPWAVDVASGVESSPGVKSSVRVLQFCHEVQCV